jgi:hypothetical protein
MEQKKKNTFEKTESPLPAKKMDILYSSTLRGIVETANYSNIQKEDILQVLPSGEGFVLLYYR